MGYTENRGHKIVKGVERYGTETYPVWYSTRITRVVNSAGNVRADVMAYRMTREPIGQYLGDVVGHFSEPWQRYMDTQHAEALSELLALREDTTDMDLLNWTTGMLLAAGMHAEMMA